MLAAIIVFVIGYIIISIEHILKTHKSAIALFMASILWIIVISQHSGDHTYVSHELEVIGSEIFGLITFLLAAMTIVEILIHFRFFDIIKQRIASLGLTDRGQFLIIALLTFFLSALLDNLTITIIMIQIAKRFFHKEALLAASTGIVILANAGGAWSPIGDVTTIMLWLANKFSALEIITIGFLPSLVMGIIATYFISRRMSDTRGGHEKVPLQPLVYQEKIIITLCFLSFSLPIVMHMVHLPPYLGLLFGLGIVWTVIEYCKHWTHNFDTGKQTNLEKLIQKTDISSIKFFIGILLAVGALKAIGALDVISHLVFGETPSTLRIASGSIVMGLLSAIVDNVPLTALAIDMIQSTDSLLWVLTAITVGTGGSLLLIGSVSGVIAGGMVSDLTFGKYFRIAFLPVILGYTAAICVWVCQYFIIR